ncbi:hypothetical protein LX36DRAFT_659320 [Colletotrichum falcatum]|nr:hypothetical protein LX36DRAFT_659320 [Colletotrichum falcatum]
MYVGAVIVAINRVGNLDEASMLCIQLAFHDEVLSISQRLKIWANRASLLDLPE